MLLKRERNLIERYVACTTDATLAIRITPIGKRIVMFREFLEEDSDGIIVLDNRRNDDPVCRCEENEHCICENVIKSLIKTCEEYMK